jgi:hypothetical protein
MSRNISLLSANDRRQVERRVVDKYRLIKQTICGDHIDPEQIKQQMLAKKGILVSSTELSVQHKDLQRLREELIEPHIQTAQNSLTIQLSELDSRKKEETQAVLGEFRREISSLKLKVQSQRREIENRFSGQREELQANLEKVRTEQLERHARDISSKMDELKKQEVEILQAEREIETLSKSRIGLLKRQAGRINQIVDDAQNRALEQLMWTNDKEEARKLLDAVPTVASVIESLNEGAEGVTSLLQSINPEAAKAMNAAPRLMAPTSQEDIKEVVVVESVRIIESERQPLDGSPYSDAEVDAIVHSETRDIGR